MDKINEILEESKRALNLVKQEQTKINNDFHKRIQECAFQLPDIV